MNGGQRSLVSFAMKSLLSFLAFPVSVAVVSSLLVACASRPPIDESDAIEDCLSAPPGAMCEIYETSVGVDGEPPVVSRCLKRMDGSVACNDASPGVADPQMGS